ncbi:spore photoproduct [Agathobacter sp.]
MIYIFTAFYAEAKSIIARYDLKMQQKQAAVRFDVFSNDDIRLVITGVGEINAAAAVANIGGVYGIGADDVIVNIGSCAAENGRLFLINKITEQSTGRTFYPDMLLKSDMDECEAVTVAKPLNEAEIENLPGNDAQASCVYDMEAAAVYQAASLFVGPHRMHFIKVVSDSGEKIDQSRITEVFAAANDMICGYIDKLTETGNAYVAARDSKLYDLEQITADMRCSKVMGDQLGQLIKYCILSGIDYESAIKEFYDSGKLPCSSKKDGKICLEELKYRLL